MGDAVIKQKSNMELTEEAVRSGVRRWIIKGALGVTAYGLILFAAAGTFRWTWGWVQVGVFFLVLALHPVVLLPEHGDLLAVRERGLLEPGVKAWDRWVAALAAGVFPMACWIIAGLDFRHQWTTALRPTVVHLAGLLLVVVGYALFFAALKVNAFFTEGVRIQAERGHTVVTRGPYAVLRHPGYTGAVTAMLGTPLLLGSLAAVPPALFSAMAYWVRTALEDATLHRELPEYREYADRVRYRLMPGIW